jgi:hypothetical protein
MKRQLVKMAMGGAKHRRIDKTASGCFVRNIGGSARRRAFITSGQSSYPATLIVSIPCPLSLRSCWCDPFAIRRFTAKCNARCIDGDTAIAAGLMESSH